MKKYRIKFEVELCGENRTDALARAAIILEYSNPDTGTSEFVNWHVIRRLEVTEANMANTSETPKSSEVGKEGDGKN